MQIGLRVNVDSLFGLGMETAMGSGKVGERA
jgi:hypothetical protein